jgi:diguanylate cyclase (GGDEF)-like protein
MVSLNIQRDALVDSSPLIMNSGIALGVLPSAAPTPFLNRSPIEEQLSFLSELPLLQNLSREHLAALAADSQIARFAAGEAVVRQGEPGDSLYLVVEGRVEVLARVERDGLATESAVASLFEGDAVGELSVLDGLPRSATCVAAVPTVCVRLSRDSLRSAMRRNWELGETLLAVLAQRLRRADALLAEHARDPLTGVNNRRALYELYEREARRAQRAARRNADLGTSSRGGQSPTSLSVLFCDVDKFKTVNDTYGHHIGDEVLIAVARAMVKVGRATDHVSRFGGDEFVMLLPECAEDGAALVTHRLRDLFANDPPGPVPFSISIGSAIVDSDPPPTLDELMKKADAEMYRDKKRER